MKPLLIATAILFLIGPLYADTVTTPENTYTDANGSIIYPDGSMITSVDYSPSTQANGYDGWTEIFFSFADGTGTATNLTQDGVGESGTIDFTNPFSNLSIVWSGYYLNADGPNGTGPMGNELGNVYCDSTCTTFFAGPVDFLTWDTYGNENIPAGISSLTDPPVGTPEPGEFTFLITGLLGLVLLKSRFQ